MNFWQLHIFIAVVEYQSFSKASDMIHLSQPTVSTHIKELEAYFDCRLLNRMGKKTEPTKTGRLLYKYAKSLMKLKNEAESAVFDFLGNVKGCLSVGGSTIPAGYILPKLVGPFNSIYPGVRLDIHTGDTLQVARRIRSGAIEIGIVGAGVEDPDLEQEELTKDRMRLIMPPDHALADKASITCKDLFNCKVVGRETGSGTWKAVMAAVDNAGFDSGKLDVAVTMGNTVSVIQSVIHGVGISILSLMAVNSEISNGLLVARRIEDLDLKRKFYLTWHSKRALSPIAQKFFEFSKSHYQ